MIGRLLAEQRWMLPWMITVAVVDVAAVAVFVLGAVTDTAWATFTGLGLIWVGAFTVLAMCWTGKRRGWR